MKTWGSGRTARTQLEFLDLMFPWFFLVFQGKCRVVFRNRPRLLLLNPHSQFMKILQSLKKVKLPMCLTKYHNMKTHWGVEVFLHALLVSALDGGEWSALPPGKEPPVPIGQETEWAPEPVSIHLFQQ
jgi:hypothetical protein